MNVTIDSRERHVPEDLLDVNQTRLGLDLKFGFFRDGELNVRGEIGDGSRCVKNIGGDLDAVTSLLHIERNLAGTLRSGDDDFRIFPGFHFDAAIVNILNHHKRMAFDGEMLFDPFARASGCSAGRKQEQAGGKNRDRD
jgi:hypothetical protein